MSGAATRSPWATLQGIAAATVQPLSRAVDVALRVPGSKSYTNRALILAAASRGRSTLRGILRSDDSYFCIEALKALGAPIEVDDDVVSVHGTGGSFVAPAQPVYIGSAGTTARFLPGILASAKSGLFGVDGSVQLRQRPIGPVLTTLNELGADIRCLNGPSALPIEIAARGLNGGEVILSGSVSSQFISGILLASPLARAPVTVHICDPIVQHAYVMMTIDMMGDFGVGVEHDRALTHMRIVPSEYVGRELALEADASTAGYFFALAAISGGRVRVTNISAQTRQPDIKLLEVLERMSCRVQRGSGFVEVSGPAALRGNFTVSMKEMSDQTLTLAALAPFADGPITIVDVAHIRHHESDRIAAVCANLRALRIACDEHDDGLTVHPGRPQAAALPSFDDHRIAMSMALIGTRAEGVQVLDPGCVSKTCPTFFEEMRRVGLHVNYQS